MNSPASPPIPPKITTQYRFLHGPIKNLPEIKHSLFVVLALINCSCDTEEMLNTELEDQLNQTTVTALLKEASEEGFLFFKGSGSSRVYKLTGLGRRALFSFANLMSLLAKK